MHGAVVSIARFHSKHKPKFLNILATWCILKFFFTLSSLYPGTKRVSLSAKPPRQHLHGDVHLIDFRMHSLNVSELKVRVITIFHVRTCNKWLGKVCCLLGLAIIYSSKFPMIAPMMALIMMTTLAGYIPSAEELC